MESFKACSHHSENRTLTKTVSHKKSDEFFSILTPSNFLNCLWLLRYRPKGLGSVTGPLGCPFAQNNSSLETELFLANWITYVSMVDLIPNSCGALVFYCNYRELLQRCSNRASPSMTFFWKQQLRG